MFDVDIEQAFNNHCKAIGVKTQKQIQYEWIVNSNDLYSKIMLSHRDLGYNLKQEIRNGRGRDRFVVNSSELEKMINEAITEEMGAISKEMVDVVSQEIVNQASNAINSISVGGAAPKVKNSKMDFGKMLGRALGRAAAKVIQEITKTKRR